MPLPKKVNQQAKLVERISLVRSSRVPEPGETDVGWIRTLSPYADERAQKKNANRFVLTAINADDATTHVFRIRRRLKPLIIQINDFLIHNPSDVYQVTGTRDIDNSPWTDVMCKSIGQLGSMPHTVDNSLRATPPIDGVTNRKNPFWIPGDDLG